jgi:hypothetical protein
MTGRLHPDDLAQLAALIVAGLAQTLSSRESAQVGSGPTPILGYAGKRPDAAPDTAFLTAAQVAERYALTHGVVR